MLSPHDYYTRVRAQQEKQARIHRGLYDRLAIVRLLIFLVAVAALIYAWSTDWRAGLLLTLLLGPFFSWGISRHRAIGRRADLAEERVRIAQRELAALNHDFSAFPDGAAYFDPTHPYALDLDIFGRHSLYQFVNRTVTAPGADRLAVQLAYPAPPEIINLRRGRAWQLAGFRGARQLIAGADAGGKAVGERIAKDPTLLNALHTWREEFRAVGAEVNDTAEDAKRLREWVRREPLVRGGLATTMPWVAPLLTVAGLWWCFTQQPWQLGLLAFAPAVLMLRRYGAAVREEHIRLGTIGKLLGNYADLLAVMERYPVAEVNLLGWRAAEDIGRTNSTDASPALRKLGYYAAQLDVRNNAFAAFIEIGGLWSLHWIRNLNRWRETYRDELPGWLEALAETETALCWATLRFNQPDWTEAEFGEARRLVATDLAHPLLNPVGRVGNDLDMSTDGHIHLVTGSNMAGKSTWLRTVGVNLVLAQCGGPVCATHLRTAPLHVWTSMRSQDDLSESTSSFFAELKRLKQIIEAVAAGDPPVFFLLDEILKGTNSRDRHTGARALIRQLIRERGAGIIATHDLELADLENDPGNRVENYAMEVQTKGADLIFDYKLHRGVSTSFNATALMARMGIDIDPEDIKLHHD